MSYSATTNLSFGGLLQVVAMLLEVPSCGPCPSAALLSLTPPRPHRVITTPHTPPLNILLIRINCLTLPKCTTSSPGRVTIGPRLQLLSACRLLLSVHPPELSQPPPWTVKLPPPSHFTQASGPLPPQLLLLPPLLLHTQNPDTQVKSPD